MVLLDILRNKLSNNTMKFVKKAIFAKTEKILII